MASGRFSSILATISSLLSLVRGAPSSSSDHQPNRLVRDFRELETILRRIRAAMLAADEGEVVSDSDRLWLAELREVAFDAEDVLEEFQYEILRAQMEAGVAALAASLEKKRRDADDDGDGDDEVRPFFNPSLFPHVVVPSGISNRMKKIIDRYDEISEDREALRLTDKDGKRRFDGTAKYQRTTTHLVKSQVFGRDADIDTLIHRMFYDTRTEVSVISVVGKGGLGKTTLAQLVFNDARISRYFHLKKWIYVSEDFDVARLTKDMLEYDTMRSFDSLNLSELQEYLKMEVNGKKLLLVLDDVWNEQKSLWESFIAPLSAAELVRVIVTTRNSSVAMTMDTEFLYRLSYLPEADCRQLFESYAFYGRDTNELPKLVEIGRKIVEKCGGLPLAVKLLGGLLLHETDEESWVDVLQSQSWELEENEIFQALKISYRHLPNHLKPCFLYCSIFPKGYDLRKEILVNLWLAQGYIRPSGGRTMQEIASEYFDELHDRSFFDEKYNVFKMHDNIHDLAQHISGNECLAVINQKHLDDLDSTHHMYVNTSETLMNSLLKKELKPLRTMLLSIGYSPVLSSTCLTFASKMTSLRALHMAVLVCDELPESIFNLKHLRYLHFHANCTVRLHSSLGQLFNLYVLDLKCQNVELPCEIGSLVNLQNLSIECEGITKLPASVSQMCNLQSLYLQRCRSLGGLPESISRSHNLQKLDFRGCTGFERLPVWVFQQFNLQELNLAGCRSVKELPSIVGNLRNLKYLNLSSSGVTSLPAGIWKLNKIESFFTNLMNVRREWMPRGLGELKELVNLTALELRGLKNVDVEGAKEANLKSKHRLKHLFLKWHNRERKPPCFPKPEVRQPIDRLRLKYECASKILVGEEAMAIMLQSLEPYCNIEELHLYGYVGVKYPNWMHEPSFNKLTRVVLKECGNEKITCLPAFGQLPSLQHLTLQKISHVKSIGEGFCCSVPGMVRSPEATKVAFPSLKSLEFKYMPDLEEWNDLFNGAMPQLQYLIILNCPRLRSVTVPSKLDFLTIKECSKLGSLPGLCDLRHPFELCIHSCPELQLPQNIPLQAALYFVQISCCPNFSLLLEPNNVVTLRTLHIDFAGLYFPEDFLSNALVNLRICGCLNPVVLPQLHNLNSLKFLDIEGWSGLQLPFNFLLPPNLINLEIYNCLSPFIIPGLNNLNSLTSLSIRDCPQLQLALEVLLPSKIQNVKFRNCMKLASTLRIQDLNFLSYLSIDGCPELQFSTNDLLPKNLKEVHLEDCLRLTALVGLRSLDSLSSLHLSHCPRLRIPQDESLPRNLRTVHITDCTKLTLLAGLQELRSLEKLHLARCQMLRLASDVPLSSSPQHLEIAGCPGLTEWCDRNGYMYEKGA